MNPISSSSVFKEVLAMIKKFQDSAPEDPVPECQQCRDKGILEVWRLPDFHRGLLSNSPIGTYQINGPQWVGWYGKGRPKDAENAYISVALCECKAGQRAKLNHPNLEVFHYQEEIPF